MDDSLPNNVARNPRPPPGTPEGDLLFGVPLKFAAAGQRLTSEAATIYGSAAARIVLAAIPWMPDVTGFPVTVRDFGPRLRRPIPPSGFYNGVPVRYLRPAVAVFKAVVDLYDMEEARSFWKKLPHVPDIGDFDPLGWPRQR